ncbi:MAG: carboxypeptidase-like regulatory domain-containing protein [Thermodesulfobacteriota bacterium]
MSRSVLFFLLVTAFAAFCRPAAAVETATVAGRVLDADGRPVAGAQVFVYDSGQVKRPADFSSKKTGADGAYSVEVAPGSYWLTAAARQSGASFGPLQSGDRHSGEPEKMTLAAGERKSWDVSIFNLMEAARRFTKEKAEVVRVRGRVVDEAGKPVAMAYVVADTTARPAEIPAHVSAWTGEDGGFELLLPRGAFHVAALREFPPPRGVELGYRLDGAAAVDDLSLVVGR